MNPIIDFWIPSNLHRKSEEYHALHLAVVLSLLTLGASLFYAAIQYWGLGYSFGAIVSCVATGQVVAALVVLRFGRLQLTHVHLGHNLASSFFWGLSAASFVTGGLESPLTIWLITAPLMALMNAGRRAAWFWFTLVMLELALWAALGIGGFTFPEWMPSVQRLILLVSVMPGAMVILFFFMYYFEEAKTAAHKQSETLLLNTLPKPIVERMLRGETTIADTFPQVSVLFADIVGFTPLAATLAPEKIVRLLDAIFTAFDAIAAKYRLEKIKTIGDCYMLVGGAPLPEEQHLHNVASAALEIRDAIARIEEHLSVRLETRIGIHTGNAIAGVIGKKKFSYDLWGTTINIAHQLEASGEAGKIHVSEACYHALYKDFAFEQRCCISPERIKNHTSFAPTYFLLAE